MFWSPILHIILLALEASVCQYSTDALLYKIEVSVQSVSLTDKEIVFFY
jgi:hypothetical protein